MAKRANREQVIDAVRFAVRVGVVTAWPPNITDAAIRSARRQRFVRTFKISGVQMAQCVFGGRIEDEPTARGRALVAATPKGDVQRTTPDAPTTEGFHPDGWIVLEEKQAGKFGTIRRHFCSPACLLVFAQTGVVREPATLAERTNGGTR